VGAGSEEGLRLARQGDTKSSANDFSQIFGFDKRVRFCALIDEKGNMVSSKARPNLTSLNPEAEDKRLFAQIGLAVVMDRGWDRFFGKTKAIVISKEKVSILIYALADMRAVIVAIEPDFPMARISEIGEVIDVCELVDSELAQGPPPEGKAPV
jgi:hypothetical protein